MLLIGDDFCNFFHFLIESVLYKLFVVFSQGRVTEDKLELVLSLVWVFVENCDEMIIICYRSIIRCLLVVFQLRLLYPELEIWLGWLNFGRRFEWGDIWIHFKAYFRELIRRKSRSGLNFALNLFYLLWRNFFLFVTVSVLHFMLSYKLIIRFL